MNRMAAILTRSLKRMEGLQGPNWIYFQNGQYPCVVSTERRGIVVELGGVAYEVSLSVLIRKDAVPNAIFVDNTEVSVDWDAPEVVTAGAGSTPTAAIPFSGRRVGTKTRLYRIVTVREDGPGSHWSLDLADARR